MNRARRACPRWRATSSIAASMASVIEQTIALLNQELGEQDLLDPALPILMDDVIGQVDDFLDQFLLALQGTQMRLLLAGHEQDDLVLDLGAIHHQFVRRLRRTSLEDQAELHIGFAAQIEGKNHRLRSPATAMIAGRYGARQHDGKKSEPQGDQQVANALGQ